MGNYHEILATIQAKKSNSQDLVRRRYSRKLAKLLGRDLIVYASNFTDRGARVEATSLELEDIHGFITTLKGLTGSRLALLLHSPGGSMEAAEQLVTYLRSKYSDIIAIVPQNAFSAATMVSCACNEIVLGKHSALGPIDPQVTFSFHGGGFTSPAHAVIEEFYRAREEVLNDPNLINFWGPKLIQYPNGFLSLCEHTLEKSENIVAQWLERYMFSNHADAREKSKSIASWLASRDAHKTHSTPIMMDSAVQKGLVIQKLEDSQELQNAVLDLFHAIIATFRVTPCVKMIENHLGKGSYTLVPKSPPTS